MDLRRLHPELPKLSFAAESRLVSTLEVDFPDLKQSATGNHFKARLTAALGDYEAHDPDPDSDPEAFREMDRFLAVAGEGLYRAFMSIEEAEVAKLLRYRLIPDATPGK